MSILQTSVIKRVSGIDRGTRLAAWCLLPMTPLAPVAAVLVGNPPLALGGVSVICAALALVIMTWFTGFAKAALAIALLVQTMAFTAALNGHPWQIDTHMAYFAILAVIAVMYDFRILIGSAAFIAIHHLGMAVTMPMMIYPDMTEGYIARTLLHAAVVVVETVFLGLSILQRQRIDAEMAHQRDAMELASHANKKAEEAALAARRDAAEVVSVLDEHLKQLEKQNFSETINAALPAEYDQIRLTFNSLVTRLRDVLQIVSETSLDFRTSSRELSQAADDLAQRTEVQSGTLSHTADSLQGLTVQLRQTAEGTKRAEQIAARARDSALQNGETVRNAVDAMQKIEESSAEISKIISMIEDIAFQTNLLSLNAGVEAARAGETGRGFAVVASEVRALAQRTSDAAQSVKQLISRSSQHVENGSSLVNKAGKALHGIVEQVSETNTMIGEISSSVGDQASIVGELNDAVQSLDKATQHTAALCEEMTAMGHQLSQGSAGLSDALSGFQLAPTQASIRQAV